MTPTNYSAAQEALKGSPEFAAKVSEDCASRFTDSTREREYIATLARIPNDKRLPQVICSRVYKGIASGRLTYDDYRASMMGQTRPEVIKVIQNR